MIKCFRHSGIVVSNLKKSEYFYCKLLNFKILQRLVEEGPYWNKLINEKNTSVKVIKASLPDKTVLELTEFQGVRRRKISKPRRYSPVGTIHLCFTVKNIDNYFKRLSKNKIKFISPPLKSDFDPVSTCFFLDPDYNYVQLVEDH